MCPPVILVFFEGSQQAWGAEQDEGPTRNNQTLGLSLDSMELYRNNTQSGLALEKKQGLVLSVLPRGSSTRR